MPQIHKKIISKYYGCLYVNDFFMYLWHWLLFLLFKFLFYWCPCCFLLNEPAYSLSILSYEESVIGCIDFYCFLGHYFICRILCLFVSYYNFHGFPFTDYYSYTWLHNFLYLLIFILTF